MGIHFKSKIYKELDGISENMMEHLDSIFTLNEISDEETKVILFFTNYTLLVNSIPNFNTLDEDYQTYLIKTSLTKICKKPVIIRKHNILEIEVNSWSVIVDIKQAIKVDWDIGKVNEWFHKI
jgi:hypothetical protein